MNDFLIDKEQYINFKQLLEDVNNATSYCEAFQYTSLYPFFRNFIVALCNDLDLVMIDSGMSNSEMTSMNIERINQPKCFIAKSFKSTYELIVSVLHSTSKITLFTSGTTGQPKKVIHSVSSLTRTTRIASKYQNQVWAYAYNPTHMAGLQVFFQAFSNGNTLINLFGRQRIEVLTSIKEFGITHISATPTFYRLLQPMIEPYKSVERVTLGGEKSDTKLLSAIAEMFPNARINNVYASTEAGTLFAAKGETFQIPETIRHLIKIEDNELMIHQSLLGSSENIVLNNSYYSTGDIIEWVDSEEGLFKFKNRKNELINVGGNKVNPTEIESILTEFKGIIQAYVYGRPNAILGNVLCAEVVCKEGVVITEPEIRIWLTNKIQDYKIPRKIKLVEKLELTKTGKIKRL